MAGMRYIKRADPVRLLEHDGSPVDDDRTGLWDLDKLLLKLLNNPQWIRTYDLARSGRAIEVAFQGKSPVVVLAEDDWKNLKVCIEKPQELLANGSVLMGLGLMPGAHRQIIPLMDSIMLASDKPVEIVEESAG